jgi:hypothetical protein
MKRTRQPLRVQGQRPADERTLTLADLAQVIGGDVYLHNPRGSNDRLDAGR